ncbi:MAG TPA: DUF4149 domain-containing protein [Gemmatimonadaceae bacterium]|nr:DUF4149 domain-containing protein [Gemmatimonadaceae bacterium]
MSAVVAPAAVAARAGEGTLASAWLLGAIVALAAWLGAALLAAAVVAPAAFAALPSRALAGAVVGRVLPVVFLSGAAVGALVAAGAVSAGGAGAAHGRWRAAAAAVLALSCALAQFAVAPRIERARAAIGASIDSVPADDPRRATFGRLHGLSVLCLGVGMLAAGTALGLSAAAARSVPAREWPR